LGEEEKRSWKEIREREDVLYEGDEMR